MSFNMTISDRRVIEALRTGVPIRDVIDVLGSGQPQLEIQFKQLLDSKRQGLKVPSNGFVFFGGFGTGKSHVLEAFTKIAIDSNFVVSRATISNNLKLGTPKDVVKSLVANTQTKAHLENGLEQLMADALERQINLDSLISWLSTEIKLGKISSIYLGIAEQLPNISYGTEAFEFIMDYLRGGSIAPKLKVALGRRDLHTPAEKSRPAETSAFLTRLFISLGYSGWVVLFDELELIRILASNSNRGKSYAELAHWMGYNDLRPTQGLAVVGCMTAGYVGERISYSNPKGPNEISTIPDRMSANLNTSSLAASAKIGMQLLQQWDSQKDEKSLQLVKPSNEAVREIQAELIKIYEAAYQTSVSPIPIKDLSKSQDPMRVHIRRWIVSWDLERQGKKAELTDNRVEQNFDVMNDDDDDDDIDD
jgi:hypothetical protein